MRSTASYPTLGYSRQLLSPLAWHGLAYRSSAPEPGVHAHQLQHSTASAPLAATFAVSVFVLDTELLASVNNSRVSSQQLLAEEKAESDLEDDLNDLDDLEDDLEDLEDDLEDDLGEDLDEDLDELDDLEDDLDDLDDLDEELDFGDDEDDFDEDDLEFDDLDDNQED